MASLTYGNITEIAGVQSSAFGEPLAVQIYPVVQLDGVHGLTDDVETFSDSSPGTGSATVNSSRLFEVATGTGVGGYGTIRSKRQVTYHPGQGTLARFTAQFDAGVASYFSFAGAFTAENGIGFGYDGTDFGVYRQTAGKLEIRTLTVTANATGNETITLQLNGTSDNTITVTNGTAAQNAYEIISDANFISTFGGSWSAYQNGDTIILVARSTGVRSGTYSISSTGALTGSFSQDQAGAANVWSHITEGNWSGSLPFTLDPSKINVYQVKLPWLGVGTITYWVMNPATGQFVLCHAIEFPNANTAPHLTSPYLSLGWASASLGSTTDLSVTGASAMGAVEGIPRSRRNTRAFDNELGSIGTTFEPVFSLRVRPEMNGVVSHREIRIVNVEVTNESSTKGGRFEVLLNTTLSGTPNWSYVDETNSCVETEIAATGVSGGDVIAAGTVGPQSTEKLSVALEGDRFERTDVITIACRTTSGGSGVTFAASAVWEEI